MVVLLHDAIEPGFLATRLQQSHLPGLLHDVEVAIDGSQTYSGHLPTNRAIQLGGRRMTFGLPEYFEDYAVLDGVTLGSGDGHFFFHYNQ